MTQNKIKTLLVNASSGFFARNFLRTDASKLIKESGMMRVVVLVPEGKLEYYKKEFDEPHIVFDILAETRGLLLEAIFEFIDHASIHSKTAWMFHKSEFYRRGGNILIRYPRLWIRRFFWHLGKYKWWRNFLRLIYYMIPSKAYAPAFDKYKPDIVFCPTMVYHDQLILKEAKKKKVKTLGMVLSWDNLYTKTFLRVHPDRLLTQTSVIRDQAIKSGDYPAGHITVVGIPQYDRYFKKTKTIPRAEFIKNLGGDQSRKLLLYAFSGKLALDIEFNVLECLAEAIKSGKIKQKVDVLVRPYPRYDFPDWRLREIKEKYGFLVAGATAHIGGSSNDWEFDAKSIELLDNSLAHSDMVLATCTTFFIEGAIFDKPLIGIAFDGKKDLPYWLSARRFFEWEHLALLGSNGGIKLAKSADELAEAVNDYLENPKLLANGRARIVKQQCEYSDGESGKRVAEALLSFLE
jgi:hypothetical protein